MVIKNQINILNNLDKDQLRYVAEVYMNSDDQAVRDTGNMLNYLSNAGEEEIYDAVITGQLIDYGMETALEGIVKTAEFSFVAVDIANMIVSEFTSVDKVAKLVDEVKWANTAADTAYENYVTAMQKYESTQSDEDLEEYYRTMKVYYGTAAQSEAALLKVYEEVDDAKLGDLWIRDDYQTMMEQLRGEVKYYQKSADQATVLYEYWKTGDYAYYTAAMDELHEKYAEEEG